MIREVRSIEYSETKPFLMSVHYARRMPTISFAFGLFIDDKLKGVVTYGKPASPNLCIGVAGKDNAERVFELNRLVIIDETKNNASYLVGNSLKMLPPGLIVVSYADEGWHHVGYVYQATNFLYTGKTKERTDIYSEGHGRHYDPNETRRQFRSSKHRYVTFTGTKRDKRELRQALRWPVFEEYPKGESIHYSLDNPVPYEEALMKEKKKEDQMEFLFMNNIDDDVRRSLYD